MTRLIILAAGILAFSASAAGPELDTANQRIISLEATLKVVQAENAALAANLASMQNDVYQMQVKMAVQAKAIQDAAVNQEPCK
jgi:hypothetical protein